MVASGDGGRAVEGNSFIIASHSARLQPNTQRGTNDESTINNSICFFPFQLIFSVYIVFIVHVILQYSNFGSAFCFHNGLHWNN